MRNSLFLRSIMLLSVILMSADAKPLTECNIITECVYSTSDYNEVTEGFIKGIKF